jgi:hypothetical protein
LRSAVEMACSLKLNTPTNESRQGLGGKLAGLLGSAAPASARRA